MNWPRVTIKSCGLVRLLNDQPWDEVRPGVLERTVSWQGQYFEQRRFVCQDCRKEILTMDEMPMVGDTLWNQVCPTNGLICPPCFEKRLGRDLSLADLKHCPLTVHWVALVRPHIMRDPQWLTWALDGYHSRLNRTTPC